MKSTNILSIGRELTSLKVALYKWTRCCRIQTARPSSFKPTQSNMKISTDLKVTTPAKINKAISTPR
jgi:hypothetical protein